MSCARARRSPESSSAAASRSFSPCYSRTRATSQRAAGPRQIALAEVVRSSGAGLQLRCAGLLYDAPSLWGAPGLVLEAGERVVVCTEDGQTLYILGRVEPLG